MNIFELSISWIQFHALKIRVQDGIYIRTIESLEIGDVIKFNSFNQLTQRQENIYRIVDTIHWDAPLNDEYTDWTKVDFSREDFKPSEKMLSAQLHHPRNGGASFHA